MALYSRIVQTLFRLIEELHTRNWLQQLSSVQDLIKDFIAMDRIEYRKAWLVYMADMESLNVEKSETWDYFMESNFSLQQSDIPIGWYSNSNWWVVIGCDHAGEQVNHEDKTCGGLKSITRIQNSRNQHYLVTPILAQVLEEIMTKRLVFFDFSKYTPPA